MESTTQRTSSRRRGRAWVIGTFLCGMVVLGVSLTLLVADALHRRTTERGNEAFERLADRIVGHVRSRTVLFEYGLRGGRGVLTVDPGADLESWRRYMLTRDPQREFPGALGFGYIARVQRSELPAYLERMRELSDDDFEVHTRGLAATEHDDLFVIQYIEPLEPNRRARGLDVGAEERRREAAERAMRSGAAALTAPIDLVQVDGVHRGFLYVIPVYSTVVVPAELHEREASLQGWVYAPIVMARAMDGMAELVDNHADIEIFDGERPTADNMLFDGDGHLTGQTGEIRSELYSDRQFLTARRVSVGGRDWTIHISSSPSFEALQADSSARTALIVGLLLTISITLAGFALASSRARAEALARRMTSELARRNEELEDARARADAATQAKSRFLANMSHELRTPMTAILGFAEYVNDPRSSEAERAEYAGAISRNGDHMLTLINEILDLSKIEAGRMSVESIDTSLVQIARDVHAVLRHRAEEKGLSIELRWCSTLPDPIRSDPTRLRQILMNLVGNAVKFTASGGVVIEIEHRSDERERIELRVIDTGKGLDPDQLTRLFQPFVQADDSVTREHGGTGLGLSISRELSRLLGGELSARCELGRGCAFVVEIPLVVSPTTRWIDAKAAERAAAKSRSPEAPQLRGKVLVVDDGPDNRRLVSLILQRAGVTAETACNGREGVECARAAQAAGEPFDLVLMDMQMPELDGLDAVGVMRAAGIVAPVAALTANASVEDRAACLAAGCVGFLTKPVDRRLLYEVVAQHVASPAKA